MTKKLVENGKLSDPLYAHVARALRADIANGTYPVGSQLPAEDKLSDRFSVSRHTVRDALRRLREDRLITSRKGSGSMVAAPLAAHTRVLHATSINELLAFARGMRFEIDSIGMEPVKGAIATQLGAQNGEEWLVVRGVGITDGHELPDCWAEYFINREFAAVARVLRRHAGPIFPLIEDMFGQTIVEVNQDISAALISAALSPILKVEAHSGAIIVLRTYKTAGGKMVQATVSTHPASRFRHSMTLRRVHA